MLQERQQSADEVLAAERQQHEAMKEQVRRLDFRTEVLTLRLRLRLSHTLLGYSLLTQPL